MPSPECLPRTVLWMSIPNLSTVCWNASVLEHIVSAAGHFVRMDESTSLIMKGHFARVTVKVDTSCHLVPGTDVFLEGVDVPLFSSN